MKANEILTDIRKVARRTSDGAIAVAMNTKKTLCFFNKGFWGSYDTRFVHGDDWQPLLTEEEWRAKYPLPDLTAAQSEPTTAEAVESLAGEVTPPWTREVKDDPEHIRLAKELAAQTVDHFAKAIADVGANAWQPLLANPVGERLTEAPEVGTWVAMFEASGKWRSIGVWQEWWRMNSDCNVYRWLGPIPVEPEKVEPPKWLGAVAQRECHANQDWRLVVYIVDEPGYPDEGESHRLRGVSNHNGKPTWDGICVSDARLITDDPDYPPSPELAALFGEEGVE